MMLFDFFYCSEDEDDRANYHCAREKSHVCEIHKSTCAEEKDDSSGD